MLDTYEDANMGVIRNLHDLGKYLAGKLPVLEDPGISIGNRPPTGDRPS